MTTRIARTTLIPIASAILACGAACPHAPPLETLSTSTVTTPTTAPVDTPSTAPVESPTTSPIDAPTNAYYVSPAGSDAPGGGTAAAPWRSIQYAIDHADSAATLTPVLHVAAGTYAGKLTITHALTIRGDSPGAVTLRNTADTDYVVRITGGSVTLDSITIDGNLSANPGLLATGAQLTLSHVTVNAPGGYGIILENCPSFDIDHCTVGTDFLLYSDIGIDIRNTAATPSTGTIASLSAGDHIDHIINVGLNCNVTIRDCTLRGSDIYWADGIRIQGASTVTISNTTILRPAGSAAAASGPPHNPPYAGVEVATASDAGALVTITGCTISGFDVGIGINMIGNRLALQGCTLQQNIAAAVSAVWNGTAASPYPTIDLGGGPLGSAGDNTFGATETYAIDLAAPYDITAQHCAWNVPAPSIPTRIRDHATVPAAGSVHY